MTDDITIRKCEEKDAEAFIGLNLAFMQETIGDNPYWSSMNKSSEELKRVFEAAMAVPELIGIFVVEADGKVIGYANTWTVFSIWSGGKALTIDDIYIAPAYRGCGIGRKLMEHLVNYAGQGGYKRVQLHAELNNGKAHSLYRKSGFSEEEMLFFIKVIKQ